MPSFDPPLHSYTHPGIHDLRVRAHVLECVLCARAHERVCA